MTYAPAVLPFRVYRPDVGHSELVVAATRFAEDAAALVALLGEGATVRYGTKFNALLVWTEGEDGDAGESYDTAAGVMHRRIDAQKARAS